MNEGVYHCDCDPHGDNAKCDRPCAKPWGVPMKNERITTDFAEGWRAGFEAARVQLEAAAEKAMADYRSVMKAMRAVEMAEPRRDDS